MEESFIIAWWSGGVTSAVACRLALQKYKNVRIVYIETGSHHPDNIRFKKDCEQWYGQNIETIQNNKYENHLDVVITDRYINGVAGAACTSKLKKNVRIKFEKENSISNQVWGFEFTKKEINRAVRVQETYPYTNPLFPLIEEKLNKKECHGILSMAGIEIPEMYKLGYSNNNCIGCVKGGAGYWNKIRIDFPDVFKQMAEAEREIGATCLKNKNGKLYLDELDASSGRASDIIIGDCGIFCQVSFADILHPKTNLVLNGESIYTNNYFE